MVQVERAVLHIGYEATEGMIEFEQSVCDIAAVLLFLVVVSLVGLFVLITCCSFARIGRWDQWTWLVGWV